MYHFGSHDPAAAVYQDLPVLLGDNNNAGSSGSGSGVALEQKLQRFPSFCHGGDPAAAAASSMQFDHLSHHLTLEACKQELIPTSHLLHPGPDGAFCFEPTEPAMAEMFFAGLPPPPQVEPTVFYDPLSQPFVVREALGSFPHVSGLVAAAGALHGEQQQQLLDSSPVHTHSQRQQGGFWGMKPQGGQKNEKQRRERLGKKFEDLKSLIPNSTKPYRASIVADTIEYINELLRTVEELKLLVEKKRHRREKARKTTAEAGSEADHQAAAAAADAAAAAAGDVESSSLIPIGGGGGSAGDRAFDGTLRSSWIQRRSKETFVDVRIVDDEVNIKLTRRKRADCLLTVARVLDELRLELLHISGGIVGGSHIFMINTKIHEGSSVFASAIAEKIMEAMDIDNVGF